jgi:hypothetical protein
VAPTRASVKWRSFWGFMGLIAIGERSIRQLNLFPHKVALALYFEHFRRRLVAPARICAFWRSTRRTLPKTASHLHYSRSCRSMRHSRRSEHETFEYRDDTNAIEALFASSHAFGRAYPLGLVWPSGWVWHGGEGQYYLGSTQFWVHS